MITRDLPLALSGPGGFTAPPALRAVLEMSLQSQGSHDGLASLSDNCNKLPINDEWVYVAPSPRSITPFGGFYAPLAETEKVDCSRNTLQSNADRIPELADHHLKPTRRFGADTFNSHAYHNQEYSGSQQPAPSLVPDERASIRYDDGPLVQTKWVANGFTVSSRRRPGKVKHYITQPKDLYASPWESSGRQRSQCLETMTKSQVWKWRGRPIQTREDYAQRPKLETHSPEHKAKPNESSRAEHSGSALLERNHHRLDQGIAAASYTLDETQEASRNMSDRCMMVSVEELARLVEKNEEIATETLQTAVRELSNQTQLHENLQKATVDLQRQVSALATHVSVLRQALPISAGIERSQLSHPVSHQYYEAPAPPRRPASAEYS